MSKTEKIWTVSTGRGLRVWSSHGRSRTDDQSASFGPYSNQCWQPRRNTGGPEGHAGLESDNRVASMLFQKCSGGHLMPGAPREEGADASDCTVLPGAGQERRW